MGKRYLPAIERDDDWTDWQHPQPGYRMACCDCGLVHDMQFKAFRPTRRKARPGYICVGPEIKNVRIMFRASRNTRATAQIRRHKNKKQTVS